MKKLNLFLLLLCGLVAACTTEDPTQNVDKPVEQDVEVKFKAYIQQATRATETSFEKGDAISVFAVEPSANISLEASGNYADNIKYVYNGSTFEASADAIKFDDSYEEGLAYFAIYPYSYSVSSKYTFSVKNDQSSLENYTASDLCVAYNAPTTDETVLLEFNHSLSNVVIKFQGSNLASKNLSVELSDVYTSCDVDINSNTFKAKGSKQNVVMGEESVNTFHEIIVPQTVSADDTFKIVTVGGKQ
ncbi:MAG: fimbrillin family protein, partial [Alistipes sp.]|nr:fimbrillin family protein [Alistipes sp.]